MPSRYIVGLVGLVAALGTVAVPTRSAFSGTTANPVSSFSASSSFCSGQSIAWLTDFEHGVISASSGSGMFDSWSTAGGSPAIDSIVARSGNYSMKIAKSSAGTSYASINSTASVAVMRFAIRFPSLPSASVAELGRISPLDPSVNPRVADWAINGVYQGQVTTAAATTVDRVRFGSNTAGDVFTAYYDDLAVSWTASDFPLADGHIQALRPNGVTAVNDPVGSKLKDETGTNVAVATPGISAKLADTPMTSTADCIKHIGTDSTSYAELSFTDTSRNACINAVNAVVAQHGSNATGGIGATYVYDGATQRTLAASATISGTSIKYRAAVITPGSGSWTPTKLNALVARVGYSSNATSTNYPAWDALLLEYDTVANPAATYEAIVTADSPSSLWHLGDKSGTTATATIGSVTGTYTGGPVLATSSLIGDTDSGVGFDGVDDYVSFGDNYRFSANAPFSIEVWLNPTAATANERTVVTKEDGGVGWALVLNPTTNTIAIERGSSGAWDMANSTTALKQGTWYHVVGTYDGSSLRTYVNGTLETTLASSRSLPVITDNLQLSGSVGSSQYSGMMDEFAIYPTALPAARVLAHHNAGKL